MKEINRAMSKLFHTLCANLTETRKNTSNYKVMKKGFGYYLIMVFCLP